MELQQWRPAAEALHRAQIVLEKLCAALPEDERMVYKQKVLYLFYVPMVHSPANHVVLSYEGLIRLGPAILELTSFAHVGHVYEYTIHCFI